MAILLAIPILGLLIIFQSAILSQVHLLQGSIDFVLLVLVAWAVQDFEPFESGSGSKGIWPPWRGISRGL